MTKVLENMSYEDLLQVSKNLLLEKSELESKVSDLKFRIDQLNRLIYGSKRERFVKNADENQMTLPFEVENEKEPEKQQETITYVRKKNKRKNHPGRIALPPHLPVKEIVIEPEQDTTGMKCIGREITEQLDYSPAKLSVIRYIRPKYMKLEDDQTLTHKGVIGKLPASPIEKCMATPATLAIIPVDKFVYHIPLNRQQERFLQGGVRIPSSTINGWLEAICHLLWPLYENLKRRILAQGYLQVDETPIQVLDKTKKGKTHRGYHWIYHSPLEKSVLFDYQPGRSREGPRQMLKGFKGYLQTDGYGVYDFIAKRKDIIHVNCMAHGRRGFETALADDREKAEYALEMFQKVYAIERKAREENLSPEERYNLRLEKALPILNELGKWMVETYKTSRPKSPIGKAVSYCISRWDSMTNYLHDGSLEIDNNLAENAIRPIALGRKNYLFAGSHKGAERAAMFYSFFATCKKNDVNPYEWLKKVLEIIPSHKVNMLHELLPQNLKL